MKKLATTTIVILSISLLFSPSLLGVQAANLNWNIQTVTGYGSDPYGRSGPNGGALALDLQDNPHMTYAERTYQGGYSSVNLWYDIWNGTGWDSQIADINYGGIPSLVLEKRGDPQVPHICYSWGQGLVYVTWNHTAWNSQIVDPNGGEGSIALDSSVKPHISYCLMADYYSGNHSLRYASWVPWSGINLASSGWSVQTVDSSGNFGEYTSLALDSNDNPYIGYYDTDSSVLKVASLKNSTWNIQTVGSGLNPSLVLDPNGNPHISYTYQYTAQNSDRYDLRYASWNGSNWDIQTIDSNQTIMPTSSLVLGSSGNPQICYGADTGLMYANWTGSDWSIQTVDSKSVGSGGVLVLDSVGAPHIGYYNDRGLVYASFVGLALSENGTSPSPTFTLTPTQGNTTPPSTMLASIDYVYAAIIVAVVVVVVIAAVLMTQRKRRAKKTKNNSPSISAQFHKGFGAIK